jgi:hypothetical protein
LPEAGQTVIPSALPLKWRVADPVLMFWSVFQPKTQGIRSIFRPGA